MALHLVTGGCGFIGSRVVADLTARGEKVRVLDLLGEAARPDPRVECIQGSILDVNRVRECLRGVDYVHHNAALVPLGRSPKQFMALNFEGTRIVHDLARRAGVKHFCHMSSSAVLGDSGIKTRPLDEEEATPAPFEPYGESKRKAEDYLLEARKTSGKMGCSILRPRTVVGPGRLGIFQILFEWVRRGKRVYCIGDGSNSFQLLHVGDLSRASLEAASRGKSGIFHLGSRHYGTLRQALQSLCDHAGTGSRIACLPALPAKVGLWALDRLNASPFGMWHYRSFDRDFHFDVSKAMRELDWRPAYSNQAMLAEAYDWYVARHDRLEAESSRGLSLHRRPPRRGLTALIR